MVARLVHRANGSDRNDQPYTEDEIDEFFILTASGEMFRIPLAAFGGRVRANLGVKYSKYRVALI